VGDYLLSNQICVERKTVIDFLASINSGRLYNQCTAMQNFYQKPLLLIETGADNLSPFKRISSVEKKLMINNLVLIAMHFPLLNIIWSPSIYFTSEIFTYLKDKQPEPISADCISSSDQENNISTQMCKLSIMRFLSKLPGIDSKTIFSLKNSGKITKAIISNNLQDLILIIGSSQNASAFYKFVNKEFSIDDIEDK
ncbi:MAG: DNA repair endonuclease XPF, partial [Paramarteilia canceri]